MKTIYLIVLIIATILVQSQSKKIPVNFLDSSLEISFEKGETWVNPALISNNDSSKAGPHFVIWIEDSEGYFIKTLYITENKAVGKNISEKEYNADVLPFWTHKSIGNKTNTDSISFDLGFILYVEINSPMDYNEHFPAPDPDDKTIFYAGQPSLIYYKKIILEGPNTIDLELLGYGGNEKILIDLPTITTARKIVNSISVHIF